MAVLAACAVDPGRRADGPAEVPIAPKMVLKLPRTLVYLPPADGIRLMHALGERPGAEVLGVVLSHAGNVPRMLIIFATERDARGVTQIQLVGWDEAPGVRSLIEEILLAREQRGEM